MGIIIIFYFQFSYFYHRFLTNFLFYCFNWYCIIFLLKRSQERLQERLVLILEHVRPKAPRSAGGAFFVADCDPQATVPLALRIGLGKIKI